MKFTAPSNDYAKAIRIILYDYTAGTNMMKVLKRNPFFWKFQTRISNICKYHDTFRRNLLKTPIAFKDNLTKKDGYYTQYTFLGSRQYLINLYNKINKEGLYRAHKPKK